VSVEQGYDPRDFSLVGFGGAGPLHANALGILTGAFPVIVPPGPGVLCAYGDATTQVQDEATRTYIRMAPEVSSEQLLEDLLELQSRGGESLVEDGIPTEEHEVTFQADLRYVGQAFQITVDFTEAELRAGGVTLLTETFDEEHEQLFTFQLGDGHEILMIRAVVKAQTQAIADFQRGQAGASLADCVMHETSIYHEGQDFDAIIYDRNKLHEGLEVPGPAIVSEMDSTTVVLPGYIARVDNIGNLLIDRV
jgi:N-methylhydantoinase A